MPDAPRVPAGQRLYLRIYLALLGSLLAAALLFALAHLHFDPARAGLAIVGPGRHVLGLAVMLAMIALVVAAGAYPVVRRLTRRLERLQHSVQAWGEGQFATRVAVEGKDEVAQLAASFNEAAARIESLVAAQKSLLANASHELRSPLARIRMAAELMAEQAPPAIQAELRRNVMELDQLIDEILLASRLDAGARAMPCFEELDLTGLVAEECARVNAALEVDPMAHPISLMGEPKLLRRMVRNLLENAVRYGAGSKVEVQLADTGSGTLRLDVCDEGQGIPKPERERIFEPFYRIAGASEAAGGVGLGLALVQQIARRHGGDAQCLANGAGAGACLRVTLPLAPDPLTPRRAPAPASVQTSTQSQRPPTSPSSAS
jgi:signal transduction histidine kinase